MIQRYHLFIWRLFLASLFALFANARAADWPEDYVVHKDTLSPDGRYGIAVPTIEAGSSGGGDNTNYLADVQKHRTLGKIACDEYFEGENHRGLKAIWAPDSTWCVAVYEGRFGFGSIAILEPKRSGVVETDLGKRIDKSLAAAAGSEGTGSVYFRPAPKRRLLVRALYYTGNPKGDDENAKYARFEGTYDLNSRKWTKAEARKTKDWDGLGTAYADDSGAHLIVSPDRKVPDGFTGTILASEKEKADYLDRQMNAVYQGVRAVLPPERFEKVKKDQIEWLKTRDAASSEAEKSKLLEARIKALRDLLW